MTLLVALALLAQNDKAQANAYDNAWESAWVAHCRQIYYAGTGKVDGMVIHVGDSITYSRPYGLWPRSTSTNKTAEDSAISAWCLANTGSPTGATPSDTNGFNLAAVDVGPPPPTPTARSMTAASSIDASEYLTGASNNGNNPMPATSDMATARGYVADGTTYQRSLHITTVASAFANARFAVVMLGTNDFGRPATDFSNDLTGVVNALEAKNIVVILSTIPPRTGGDVSPYNTAIRTLAQSRGLPLIDYYAEILARRPGTSWQGTLISGDGVHPSYVNAENDIYAGGDVGAHRTGTLATNDGYTLRGWLTMQKLKEVKANVVDPGPPAPAPGGPPPAPPPPPPVVAASGRDNDNGDGCSLGTVGARLPWGVGLLGLLLLRRRR